jgi:hypothetical protein
VEDVQEDVDRVANQEGDGERRQRAARVDAEVPEQTHYQAANAGDQEPGGGLLGARV